MGGGAGARCNDNLCTANELLFPVVDRSLLKATLAALADLASATITVTIGGGVDAACQDLATVTTSIAVDLDYGNYPLKARVCVCLCVCVCHS